MSVVGRFRLLSSALIVCVTGALVAVVDPVSASPAVQVATPGGSAVASAAALPADGDAEAVLVPELSTQTSVTMQEPNGAYTMYGAMGPINYQDASGAWVPISNDLVDAAGTTYAVENEANEFTTKLPEDASTTPVRLESDGAWVSMQMQGLSDQAPDVDGAVAAFEPDSASDTADAVEYQATEVGLKESITLDAAPAGSTDLEYVYDIDASAGLTPTLTAGGAIEFRQSPTADPYVTIPPGVMFDSATPEPATSDAVAYQLAATGTGWTLTMTVSSTWLTDSARVYPVVIDPSILYRDVATKNCWLRESTPTTSACTDGYQYMRVGRNGAGTRHRSLFQFDVSAIPPTATVWGAAVNLYLEADQSLNNLPADYSLFRAGRSWTSAATWNNSGNGAWSTAGGAPTGTALGTRTIVGDTSGFKQFVDGVGDVVRGWVDGSVVNNGLVLSQTGGTVDNILAFRSNSSLNTQPNPDGAGEPDGPGKYRRPFLGVTYNLAPDSTVNEAGDRDFWQYEKRDLTDKVNAKVNIGNGNLLLTAQDATVKGVGGWDMGLTRYYNSAAHGVGTSNMGQGWTTSFGDSVRLEFDPDYVNHNRIHFWGPSGYRASFDRIGNSNQFKRLGAGINADLTKEDDGTYTLKWFDQSRYRFSDAGRLTSTRDKNGNKLEFTYDTANGISGTVLKDVKDTRNRHAVISYSSGTISDITITTPGGATLLRWHYTYTSTAPVQLTSARLAEIGTALSGTSMTTTDPNLNAATTYTYDANGYLSEIADARENSDTNTHPGGTTHVDYWTTGTFAGRVKTLKRLTDDDDVADANLGFEYATGDGISGSAPDNAVCKTYNDTTKKGDKDADARTFVNGERTDLNTPDSDYSEDITRYCIDIKDRVLRSTDARKRGRSKTYTTNSNVETADMTGTGTGAEQYEYGYDDNDNAESSSSPEGAESSATYDDPTNTHSPSTVSGDDSGGEDISWNYGYDDRNNLIRANSRSDGAAGTGWTGYRYCWTQTGQINRIDPVVATGALSGSGYSTDPVRDTKTNGVLKTNAELCGAGSNPQGNDTLFTYFDGTEELKSVNRPAGGDQTFTYDNLSRIATVTDGRGVVTAYRYDGLDHVVKSTYTKDAQGNQPAQNQQVTWTYDPDGNLTQMVDGNGINTYSYDELNRKTGQTDHDTLGATTYQDAYTYDAASNVTTVAVAGEAEPTTYTYDNLNLVRTVDDQRAGATSITFDYDRHDKRIRTTYPMAGGSAALIQAAKWNDDGDMTCVYSFRSGNNPDDPNQPDVCPSETAAGLITFEGYDYKNADQQKTSMIWKTTELGGRVTAYDYDEIQRLKSAITTPSGSSNTALRKFDYTYDRHSNLIKDVTSSDGTPTPGLLTGTQWQAFNVGDEICAAARQARDPNLTCSTTNTAAITTYNHDEAGNLTTATGGTTATLGSGTADAVGLSLDYNLPKQTTSTDPPGAAGAQTQAYDGVMQDNRTQSGNTAMSYGFSGLSKQTTTGTTPHAESFVRDPGGKLLAMVDTTTGNASYYLTDHQDSIIGLMPDTAASITRYLYEPYGQRIRAWVDTTPGTGTTTGSENLSLSAPTSDVNPWSYASGYLDRDTGFIKFGTRYYMPRQATWTQADPKNGKANDPLSMNQYVYSAMNPINQTDSTGRYWGEDAVEDVGDAIGDAASSVGEFLDSETFACLAAMGFQVAATIGVGVALFNPATTGVAAVAVYSIDSIITYTSCNDL